MDKPAPIPPAPPLGWEIAFTRISRSVLPPIEACMADMTRQFEAIGLSCDRQVRQTPRGLSAFLAVVGQRGLLFIVDFTLVDGMAVAGQPGAALDIRVLDACGGVVAQCGAAPGDRGPADYLARPEQVLAASPLERSATSVYMLAMGHFDLIPKRPRGIEPCAR
jgi:hypothetical protein